MKVELRMTNGTLELRLAANDELEDAVLGRFTDAISRGQAVSAARDGEQHVLRVER